MSADGGPARRVAVMAGLSASLLFIVVGVGFRLQMYGDGSMFSYAVAVQEAWSYHLHNIPDRAFVYLYAFLPAELWVGFTGDAHAGILLYGLLFYGAQALGLALTFVADRSRGRIVFAFACASTACLCPLVFGFPTEMWMAHALFWPTLAAAHDPRPGIARTAAVFALMPALMLTHEGALVFAVAILAMLALRGLSDPAFWRGAAAFAIGLVIWVILKLSFPPDPYYASIIDIAALKFIDPANLTTPAFLLLVAAVVGYGIVLVAIRRLAVRTAPLIAAVLVALALAAYWLWFDHSLLAEHRYELRTVLLLGTPALGTLATAYMLHAEGRLPIPFVGSWFDAVASPAAARATVGVFTLIALVHTVETAKFVIAWNGYTSAIRALAIGTTSDPALGSPDFVSSARLDADLNRLSWFSTTPYLSVLVAPGFAPRRLVVDPDGEYYWLTCDMAHATEQAARVVPAESRRLVRIYSCLHRPE